MIDGIHRSVRFPGVLDRETLPEAGSREKSSECQAYLSDSDCLGVREKELLKLEQEFYQDDHRYWENQKPDQKPSPQMNQKWQEINEEMETDLETFSKEASRQPEIYQ